MSSNNEYFFEHICADICRVMHRGEIVQKAVEESGISIVKIADKLKVSRSTLYAKFDDPLLDWDMIIKIGKVIREDIINTRFTDAPEGLVSEPREQYRTKLDECRDELDEIRKKHILLLEQFTEVKSENERLRTILENYSKGARAG